MLPRHSVPTTLLVRLLVALLGGAALKSVVEGLRTPFGLETFYRLRACWQRRLDAVRVCLCREQPPPACDYLEPWRQTVAHLQTVFGREGDVVAAYQQRFQRALLG